MNVIVIGRNKFTGPKSWDDITPRHFLQLLNWRICLGGEPAGRWALLQLWYGIRYRHTRLLDDAQREWLISHLDFLDQAPERWILPKLKLKRRTYIGPGDGLEYLSFGEFMHAQAARDKYLSTGLTTDLAALMASLYRPKAFFWQKSGEANRQLFDMRTLTRQVSLLAHFPESVALGTLLNYEGCLERFPTQFEYLFNQSGQGDQGGTWLDVGLSLARQTSALGTFAQLEQTNLFLVLTTLDALMKENAELKAKLEEQAHG